MSLCLAHDPPLVIDDTTCSAQTPPAHAEHPQCPLGEALGVAE